MQDKAITTAMSVCDDNCYGCGGHDICYVCHCLQDKAKLDRARARELAVTRAAAEAHQKRAADHLTGNKPTIQRNK